MKIFLIAFPDVYGIDTRTQEGRHPFETCKRSSSAREGSHSLCLKLIDERHPKRILEPWPLHVKAPCSSSEFRGSSSSLIPWWHRPLASQCYDLVKACSRLSPGAAPADLDLDAAGVR